MGFSGTGISKLAGSSATIPTNRAALDAYQYTQVATNISIAAGATWLPSQTWNIGGSAFVSLVASGNTGALSWTIQVSYKVSTNTTDFSVSDANGTSTNTNGSSTTVPEEPMTPYAYPTIKNAGVSGMTNINAWLMVR